MLLEEGPAPAPAATSNTVRNILLAVAAAYVLISLYLLIDMRGRVQGLEQKQQTLEASHKQLQDRLRATDRTVTESVQALGSRVGMTQAEIDHRTAELRQQQQQLTAEQKKTQQQVSQVTGEVTGVKSDLGGAKQDIATTRTDLEAAKAKLEKAIGDLGIQSGLIARNRDELDYLKQKGDRNYFEFTLQKGKRQPVSTVSMQLKKADPKRSAFTVNVIADDRTIEKKDKTANEPLQFYTGRDHSLYELVVYQVDKDSVSGYLSTPKAIKPKAE
jgi:chromosome segregation ATPase